MKFCTRSISKVLVVAIASMAMIFVSPGGVAFAHRDGCHAQHSCPSDNGTYVCGDTGNYTYCAQRQQAPMQAVTAQQPATEKITIAAFNAMINRKSNIRSGPGTNYAIVAGGTAGQEITIVGKNANGSWYQIGEGRWIAASLVNASAAPPAIAVEVQQPIPEQTTITASKTTINRSANLRSGPGASFAIVGTGRAGQAVSIIGKNADGSWYQIGEGQWIAAFLVDTGGTAAPPTTQATVTSTASPVEPEPAKVQLPPYWKDAGVNTCGNFEWKVVDVRRPNGLWFYNTGAEKINESFLVVYVEIRHIGGYNDHLMSIRPTIGGVYEPSWDASYNAAWMMTGGQNHPWEYFTPGAVITIANAYDVPRNDAYSFQMVSCLGGAVNIGEWNALDKNAIRANTN